MKCANTEKKNGAKRNEKKKLDNRPTAKKGMEEKFNNIHSNISIKNNCTNDDDAIAAYCNTLYSAMLLVRSALNSSSRVNSITHTKVKITKRRNWTTTMTTVAAAFNGQILLRHSRNGTDDSDNGNEKKYFHKIYLYISFETKICAIIMPHNERPSVLL